MNRFSAPGRLSFFVLLAAAIALFVGGAGTTSAQGEAGEPDLTPMPGGPGIQICEPVASGGDAALADFGAGCGRWLQWEMGFHPQLGQTPPWNDSFWAHKELHVPQLRLSLAQGTRLASILGVTHVAIGQIGGTKANCLLTYQLYTVPDAKAVGAPIKLAGTEAQVIARLPDVARTLLRRLGVEPRRVPASVGATPTELTTVGRYAWDLDQKPTDADQQRIDALTHRLPLALLLSFAHYRASDLKAQEAMARRMVEQASGNFLMLGLVASYITHPSEEFAQLVDSKVAALDAPDNAVLTYWTANRARTPDEGVKADEMLVRLAPRSASAWDQLARRYALQGQSIRFARGFAALSEPVARAVMVIYERWIGAARQATKINPGFTEAWVELAQATTFAGDPAGADFALQKALALESGYVGIYLWGLEMYQPKWGGDPRNLARIAHLAAMAPLPPDTGFYSLGLTVRNLGFPDDAKLLFARAIVQAREAVLRHPNDPALHTTLGDLLSAEKQPKEGEAELKIALRLDPKAHIARYQLARLYQTQARYDEAIALMREDVRLTEGPDLPADVGFEAKLALAEALLNKSAADQSVPSDESRRLIDVVLKAQKDNYRAWEDLGFFQVQKKSYMSALGIYYAQSYRQPNNSEPHREMAHVQRLMSKYVAAALEGEKAVALAPKSYYALTELAAIYDAKGDFEGSVKMYRRAIEVLPTFAPVHLDLAKVLLKTSKKDEARAELKRALELNQPPPDLKPAIQELLDKNP